MVGVLGLASVIPWVLPTNDNYKSQVQKRSDKTGDLCTSYCQLPAPMLTLGLPDIPIIAEHKSKCKLRDLLTKLKSIYSISTKKKDHIIFDVRDTYNELYDCRILLVIQTIET